MKIKVLNTGILGVNTLIVPLCENKVFVVDPAACKTSRDSGKIVDFLKRNNLDCVAVVLTHSHFDHITGIAEVKAAFPAARIAIHKNEACELDNPPGPMGERVIRFFGLEALMDVVASQPPADVLLSDRCTLEVLLKSSDEKKAVELKNSSASSFSEASFEINSSSNLAHALSSWQVFLTPGHTPGSICLYNKNEKILISGDTLFEDGWGRTDMYGGNEREIMRSLAFLNKTIPSGTIVYSGHDSHCFILGGEN